MNRESVAEVLEVWSQEDMRQELLDKARAKRSSLPSFRLPEITPKGWGREILLANLPTYCGKLLCFNKGQKFSSHFHDLKSESFYVLSGRIRFSHFDPANADKLTRELGAGEIVDIPRLCVHQVEAIEESVVIEVSTHHEDSDSYRVEKGASQAKPVVPYLEEPGYEVEYVKQGSTPGADGFWEYWEEKRSKWTHVSGEPEADAYICDVYVRRKESKWKS